MKANNPSVWSCIMSGGMLHFHLYHGPVTDGSSASYKPDVTLCYG